MGIDGGPAESWSEVHGFLVLRWLDVQDARVARWSTVHGFPAQGWLEIHVSYEEGWLDIHGYPVDGISEDHDEDGLRNVHGAPVCLSSEMVTNFTKVES